MAPNVGGAATKPVATAPASPRKGHRAPASPSKAQSVRHTMKASPIKAERSTKSRAAPPAEDKENNPDPTPEQRAEQHKLKGNAAFHAQRYDEGVQHYSAGLSLPGLPKSIRAILHCNRAAALQALRRFVDAVGDCFAAHELDPTYTRALQRRADAYLALGDYTSAVKDMEALGPEGLGTEGMARFEDAKRKARKGSQPDLYAVLGVANGASSGEIKSAYRQLALRHHPDKAPDGAQRDAAEVLFKLVGMAYSTLSDAQARRKYDASQLASRFRRSSSFS